MTDTELAAHLHAVHGESLLYAVCAEGGGLRLRHERLHARSGVDHHHAVEVGNAN